MPVRYDHGSQWLAPIWVVTGSEFIADGRWLVSGLQSTCISSSRSPRRVVVLGATGSIGVNTLEVIAALAPDYEVLGLSAHSNWQRACQQATQFQPRFLTLTDPASLAALDRRQLPTDCELLVGEEGLARMIHDPDTDIVVSAIVGAAGLFGSWQAVEAGKTLALANKETMVVAGSLIVPRAKEQGVVVVPVDSEHSAIFQALDLAKPHHVERIVLTASGGPFRGRRRDQLHQVSVQEALQHPTWQMGARITIDSATLLNKALEVIETRWLFDLPPEQIEVIIHPESIVHSFVEFVDGSVLAQLSPPDMRLPIQYALTYPERCPGPARKMDWSALRQLTFEPPDRATFEGLELGFTVARTGGTAGAVLNAAKEAAVDRFLAGRLGFLEIATVCQSVLAHHNFIAQPTLEELTAADRWARQEVTRWKRQPHPMPSP